MLSGRPGLPALPLSTPVLPQGPNGPAARALGGRCQASHHRVHPVQHVAPVVETGPQS